MKIVVASDSFKGSLSSKEVEEAVKQGFLRVYPSAEIICIPVADGGEGTVDAFMSHAPGELCFKNVRSPMGECIEAKYARINGKTAVIELAAASGLMLVAEGLRNPLAADTFGTGQLIEDAVARGCNEIVLGLGGSATNDGGMGIMRALGAVFYDKQSHELTQPNELDKLWRVDVARMEKVLCGVKIILATDVKNPLCGKNGATYIFGAQKGVKKRDTELLDACLGKLGDVLEAKTGKNLKSVHGIGAAGGAGLGLYAFQNARIDSGIEVVLKCAEIDTYIKDASLVITGEGKIDAQSVFGKVTVGVAAHAKKYGVPVVAIVGGTGDGANAVYDCGIDVVFPITDCPMSLCEAMSNAKNLVADTAERLARSIRMARCIKY